MPKYDYIIVGAGLFGCVLARELMNAGKKCLIVEKRNHTGGNLYCENIDGISVHKYGAHIFHTSSDVAWNYVSMYTEMSAFVNSPVANYKGEIYNMPFNMNTFSKLWNIASPDEARKIIDEQRREISNEPENLEEQAISLVGRDVYEKLIKGYTEKQWGRPCKELPAFIIKRVPVRFTYDNNYFSDRHQGVPVGGYNHLINRLTEGAEILTNTDFLLNRDMANSAENIVFTGQIDAYYDYIFGCLEYRSLRFDTKRFDTDNRQGVAVMNYTDIDTPYTRTIEHKWFEKTKSDITYVTYEYPEKWAPGGEPYYPVNDEKNQSLYKKYADLAKSEKNVFFGGRLGGYGYYDMDKTILISLELANSLLKGN